MSSRINVLIIDDEQEMLKSFEKLFSRKEIYNLTMLSDTDKAIEEVKKDKYHILLADLKLGAITGIDLCKIAVENNPKIVVIIITGYGTIEVGVEAIKAGAYDFLEKPFTSQKLFEILEKATQTKKEEKSNPPGEITNTCGMIYKSKEMHEVFDTINKIAGSDVNVLIQGESGTGKEIVSRAVHRLSNRSEKPFVPVNCGALPENLFESELFGHEKGAFTGALSTKPGLLEFADNGTFFFDEITELPLQIQSKLLRMLEDKKIRRVGGQKEVELNVRIVAASNQELEEAVKSGRFREDLYYRLTSIVIHIPPLRERRDDILPIFYHYLKDFCKRNSKKEKKITKNAENALVNYDWPGNVRELINVVNKMYLICNQDLITEDDLPLPTKKPQAVFMNSIKSLSYKDAKDKVLEKFDVEYLKYNISRYDGNISKTAEMCGIDRRTIHRMIQKYGIVYKD